MECYSIINEMSQKVAFPEGNSFTWIRILKDDKSGIAKAAKLLYIEQEELESQLSAIQRPRAEVERFLTVIYSAPYPSSEETVLPVHFYIYKNYFITIEHEPHPVMNRIEKLFAENKVRFLARKRKIQAYFLFYIIDMLNDSFLETVDKTMNDIELFDRKRSLFYEMSDRVYERISDASIMSSYFNHALIANLEVLNFLRKLHKGFLLDDDRENFNDLYLNVMQILDTEKIQRDMITNLFNLHSVIASNKLNVFMKRLTILAVVIAVPTLISSIYGMNIVGLPLAQSPLAFYLLMLFIILVSVAVFFVFIQTTNSRK